MQHINGENKTLMDVYLSLLSDAFGQSTHNEDRDAKRRARIRKAALERRRERKKQYLEELQLEKWIEFKRAQFAAEASEQSEAQP